MPFLDHRLRGGVMHSPRSIALIWFFSATRRAVIAYRYESDTLLAIGDPIGPPEEIPALLEAFQRLCHDRDWQFAFYQARPERLADYRRLGWKAIHIGEDPVLWTDRFTLEGPELGAVRRAVRKLEREGLVARMFGRLECGLDSLRNLSSSVTGTVRPYGREVDQYFVKSATQKFRPTTSGLPR